MDPSIYNIHSIYYYLKQNIKLTRKKSDLIPYINILTNIMHLKEFILISLDKQYQIEKSNQSSIPSYKSDKIRLLFLSLHSNDNTDNTDNIESLRLHNIQSEPNLLKTNTIHTNTNTNTNIKQYQHKSLQFDIEESIYVSTEESESESDVDDGDSCDDYDIDEESEHGAAFEIAGHGDTTIIYTDTELEQPDHNNLNLMHMHDMDDMDEIKELSDSQSISVENEDEYENKAHQTFNAITEMIQIGEKNGITIKSQFGANRLLSIQILNMHVDKMPISKICVKFNKNWIGLTAKTNDITLPTQIKYNQGFGFNVKMDLNSNQIIVNNNVEFVVKTNLFEIECSLNVPIYLFFDPKNEIAADNFLNLWKSADREKQCKLDIIQCKIEEIENLKNLLGLDRYKMYFVHHRIIPKKGNIFYYSLKMDETLLLFEIAIAISGKGAVITRSNDKYRSFLCANWVRLLVDTL